MATHALPVTVFAFARKNGLLAWQVALELTSDDPFEPAESVAEMEQALRAAGKQVTVYTYPGTKHWFFEDNRPEYDAHAARVAWERTIAFLHERLD